jgi:hypothetical protein
LSTLNISIADVVTLAVIYRIAIVALARKLLVALWRYLETGLVPAGAMFKPR